MPQLFHDLLQNFTPSGAGYTQSGPPDPLATGPGLLASNLAPHLGPLGAPPLTLMPLSFLLYWGQLLIYQGC